MSQTGLAPTAEHLVSESDYVQLSRLVIEHGWRTDNGRADTVHELYVDNGELILPPARLRGREAIREWGRLLVQAPPWRSIRHVRKHALRRRWAQRGSRYDRVDRIYGRGPGSRDDPAIFGRRGSRRVHSH